MVSESLKKEARKYKIRITYVTSSGKRNYRKVSVIKSDIKKKKPRKTKFGVVRKGSDGHFREENPASGIRVNPNDNTNWVWLPVRWVHCLSCGMYHSNRQIPAPFWDRNWENSSGPTSNVKAGVILVRGDNLLMTQSYNDKFGFPKGAVDKGEDIYRAAVRELKEETGVVLDVRNIRGTQPMSIISKKNVYKMFVYKVPMNFKLTSFPEDDAEITSFGWVNVNSANNLKLSNAMKSVLATYKRYHVQKETIPWKSRNKSSSDNNWRKR